MDDDVSSDVAVLSTQHYIEDGDIKYNLSNFVYSSLGYWSETELSYSKSCFLQPTFINGLACTYIV